METDKDDGKVFVLENLPANYPEEYIINYVEGCLDIDVKDVKICPYIPGRALVFLPVKLKDFSKAKGIIAKANVESQKVKMLPSSRKTAIIVNDLDFQKLSEEFLSLYFECEFADGSEVVKDSKSWPQFNMAIVYFHQDHKAVVEKILKNSDHVALPSEDYHITVQPFYENFHEYVGEKMERSEVVDAAVTKAHVSGKLINIKKNEVGVKEYNDEEAIEDPVDEIEEDEEDGEKYEDGEEEDDEEEEEHEDGEEEDDKEEEEEEDNTEESDDDDEKVKKYKNNTKDNKTGESDESSSDDERASEESLRNSGLQIDRVKMFVSQDKNASTNVRRGGCRGRGMNSFFSTAFTRGFYNPENIQHNTNECTDTSKNVSESHKSTDRISEVRESGKQHINNEQVACFPCGARSIKSSSLSQSLNDASNKPVHISQNMSGPSSSIQHQFSTSLSKHHITDMDGSSNLINKKKQLEEELDVTVSQNVPEYAAPKEAHKKTQELLEKEIKAKEEKLKQLEEEINKKKEQSQACIKKIEMDIAAWQIEFLQNSFESCDGCTVKFDKDKKCAVIEGKNEPVKECQLLLLIELKKLKEQIVVLTPAMHYILSKGQGKQFLDNLNSSSKIKGAKVLLQGESLLVVAKDEEVLNFAFEHLKNRINFKETINSVAQIPVDRVQYLQVKLENHLLVKVGWSDSESDICVEGMKEDVFEASREIKALIEKFGVHERSFAVDDVLARLFHKHFQDKITKILQDLDVIDFTSTEARLDIKFKGEEKKVNLAHRKLTEMKTKVKQKSWDLRTAFNKPEDLMLITKGFHSEKMRKKINNFEIQKKCIITTKLPQLDSFTVKVLNERQTCSTHQHFSGAKSKLKFFNTKLTKNYLKFKVTDTCQLIVKPDGDITRESSNILVCVLGPRVDLRKTKVGLAFNKLCPRLWKELKVEHESHPDDAVLITKGNLKPLSCLAICHVILTPWNPNSSPAQLSDAIQTVISQSVALGAKSISFPALGCGRAFGFPPSDVAKITCSSIKTSFMGTTVQKVVLLAPDRELFKEFKSEAPKHFKSISVQVPSAVSAASFMAPLIATNNEDEVSEDDKSENSDDNKDDDNEDDKITFDLPHNVQDSNKAEITLVGMHDSGLQNLWSELKKEIRKVCLYTDDYNQKLVDVWPKTFREKIVSEAKKLCVWVQSAPNPKTQKAGYIFKGEKQDVEKMMKIIQKEFLDLIPHLSKHQNQNKAPKRGTVEFLKHASESDKQCPSYWEKNKLKHLVTGKNLVDVDSKTKSAIEKLIASTLDLNNVGIGSDANGISYSKIKVIDVKRIENLMLFEPYLAHRNIVFKRMFEQQKLCPDIGQIRGSQGRISTTELLADFMKEELYYEINEHYLFHGTKSPDAIIANGIDPKVSSELGMFGRGIYTAERFTKADQYTDSRIRRAPRGTTLVMVLARVLLGNVFLCDDRHKSVQSKTSTKLLRPPCMLCHEDVCNCNNQTLYDSVMGDGRWLFREFVVYDKYQCYPEYLIYYQRV